MKRARQRSCIAVVQVAVLYGAMTAVLPGLNAQNVADFEKRMTDFTLGNGLKFLVLERHQAPVVSFLICIGDVANSKEDPPIAKESCQNMIRTTGGSNMRSLERVLCKWLCPTAVGTAQRD